MNFLLHRLTQKPARTSLLAGFFFALFFAAASGLSAQDANLANQYFLNGEFEKSAIMYEELLQKNPRNDVFLDRYVGSLMNLEQYDRCEKSLKEYIRIAPDDVNLYVAYGMLFDRLGKPDKAGEQFDKAIAKMAPDFNMVNRLANKFMQQTKYDYAIKTYETGEKAFNDPNRFAYNLGELYRRKGENPKMIEYYLRTIVAEPTRMGMVQSMLARFLPLEEHTELQTQLYAQLQTSPDSPEFIELLSWSFTQQKDYKSALRQLKALDKRLGENGSRIMAMAANATNDRAFDAALAAYDYILVEKGPGSSYYFQAKNSSMSCRRLKVTENYNYTLEDLRVLEQDYEAFLTEYGKGRQTSTIILQLAELEALYINDLDKAISILNELIELPGIDRKEVAQAKINLADYSLIKGDIWESTLLYSQVDKEFKEELLGQEARFKNAKLSYFNGDFQWAQAQFDVLKASTSKMIANDALDISVFIMDNLNLDTTATALEMYAQAELLVYQNRFKEAFVLLNQLRTDFPKHTLEDDIFYLEAQIAEKKQDWKRAIELYAKTAEEYPEDIRADNSLYAMARLFETRLEDKEKAMVLYEKIFMDYSGSLFSVESRKRYRVLRGDKVQ